MNARDFDVDVCVAKQDELLEHNEFISARMQGYTKKCETDCVEAVYETDENKVMATLVLILDEARKAMLGDTDDKIEFTNRAARFRDILVNDFATEQAERDWEKRND